MSPDSAPESVAWDRAEPVPEVPLPQRQRFRDESPVRLPDRGKLANNGQMKARRTSGVFVGDWRSLLIVPASIALAAGSLAGCTRPPGSLPPGSLLPCGPPGFSVNPSSAKVGEQVTVSAPDSTCNPRYGAAARIQVTVIDAMQAEILSTIAPMNDAGGFSFSFEVPAGAAAGEAAVSAAPYNIDWCDDTGKNNRAAGTAEAIQRASCAMPVSPLQITP
ncbi:hypothetical protein GCM10009569_19610 [Arthrobacter russicus]